MTTADRLPSPPANTDAPGRSRARTKRVRPETATRAAVVTRTIAVTGAAGVVGGKLVTALAGSDEVAKVIAIDLRRGAVEGVTWRIGDVRDPLLSKRLAGVDVVVHLAVDWSLEHDPLARSEVNVRGTQTVVTAAAAAGVPHVLLVTSASVYGARPDNPVPLPEDAPLQAQPDGIVADLLEIERLAQDARCVHRGLSVTVVRPGALVGEGVDTLVTRHFSAPRLLCVRDTHPHWQFCHVDDLAAALQYVALGHADTAGAHPDVVTVACEGWLEQGEVEQICGRRRIEVPAALAFATAERLHRLGVTPAPASELTLVVHPWVVDSRALRESGWRPAYDNTSALHAVLAQVSGEHALAGRRLGRRDATVAGASAAGATAAVLGAAALVLRARRARGH